MKTVFEPRADKFFPRYRLDRILSGQEFGGGSFILKDESAD